MTIAPAGSLPWLLRHELRVAWREAAFFSARGRSLRRPLAVALALQLAVLPIGWTIATAPAAPEWVAVVTTTILLALTWIGMLAQSLVTATRILFLRGDLDLLLSAPISARSVLTVRALAVAMTTITSWSLLAMLTINALVLFGQFRWLLFYPVFVALALVASAAALVLTTLLFALLGPRRMRMAAQVVAAGLGIAIVLLLQVPGFLLGGPDQAADALIPILLRSVEGGSALWWPARATLGEAAPLTALLVGALGAFALVIALAGPRFADQAKVANGAPREARVRSARAARFRGGVGGALRRKEWRLLRRDPWLVSQVVLPAVYLIPLAVLSWFNRSGAASGDVGIVFVVVMIAGAITGGLAWVTIAGEDAPELLAAAPVAPWQAMAAKLQAATLPVAVLMVVPIAALALHDALHGLVALLGCLGAVATAALLQLWHPQAGQRQRFSYRHRASILRGLFELAANAAWGAAAAATLIAPRLAAILWGIAFAAIPLLYLLRGRRGAG